MVDQELTLENLYNWLKTKNPNSAYDYGDCVNCLLAQWHNANGTEYVVILVDAVSYNEGIFERIAVKEPHTFNAALLRCEKALAGISLLEED